MKNLKDDWITIAEKIPQGSKQRTACSLGCNSSDNSQIVSHTTKGYSVICFRCGESDFKPHGTRRIQDLLRHKLERQMLIDRKVELPADYTSVVPMQAMLWYLKYGISPELAAEYGIGYTAKLNRVVLPVFNLEGELDAVQMRAVDRNHKPKYLNPFGPRVSSAVFYSSQSNGTVVIVEDILSAIKVGRVAPCISILGTTMTNERALKISETNHTAILWLDGDKAGYKGQKSAIRQLKLLGMRVYKVQTPNDPKTYNVEEIRDKLKGIIEC